MGQTCFVVMPIGKQTFGKKIIQADSLRAHYTDLIREALLKVRPDLEIIRGDEVVAPGGVTTDILKRLMYSDYVLADITYPNPNVYYELGIRHACRGQAMLIRDENGPPLPFDVSELRHTTYQATLSGLKELAEKLRRQLDWFDSHPGSPDNRFMELAQQARFEFPTYERSLFPQPIESAMVQQLHSRAFYKSRVRFEITVLSVAATHVATQTVLEYDVTNRTEEARYWDMEYKEASAGEGVVEARFRGQQLDPSVRDYRIGRGVSIRKLVEPGETAPVYFRAIEHYYHTDSELYTTYFPATDMKVVVVNPFPRLTFDFEVLYLGEVWPVIRDQDRMEVSVTTGILPYQGIRLHWRGGDR